MAKSRLSTNSSAAIGGGIGGGVVAGLMVSALALGTLSLMAPPPAGLPDPRDPANAEYDSALVPLPESSEFGKGPRDPALSLPMIDALPQADGPSLAVAPAPEARPALENDPTSRPETVQTPITLNAPQTEIAALKTPLEGETPIPVPPPGEAQAPGLGRPVSEGVVADPESFAAASHASPAQGAPAETQAAPRPSESGAASSNASGAASNTRPQKTAPGAPAAASPSPSPVTAFPSATALPPATGVTADPSGDPTENTQEAPARLPAPQDDAGMNDQTPAPQSDPSQQEVQEATPERLDAQPAPDEGAAAQGGTQDRTENETIAEEAPSRPEVIVLDSPSLPAGRPTTGFQNAGNVTTNRLPMIGGATASGAQGSGLQNSDAGELGTSASLPPIEAFALPFAGDASAPLYSVVLIDPGTKAGGLDPATLKTIGFPVTLAIDPNRAEAAQDAASYRAAGFEVAILATALPQDATAQDLEVAVEAWRQVIPEAVAIVEPPQPVLQTNRILSQTLVKILAREGLGLITQTGGLNAAEQLAVKEGVPHAQIWRVIDADRAKAPVIERMLGRAGFEASKGGAVAVMLSAWPESLSGLLTWEPSRDKTITLAPVSALALRGE